MKNLIIIGAGSAGKMVALEILQKRNISAKYNIAGFVDDDPGKKNGIQVNSHYIPVLGKIEDAPEVIRRKFINEVIIAIPSAGKDVIQRIVSILAGCMVQVKIVPGIYEIIEGRVAFNQVRQIKPQDLLGREEIGFDIEKISPFYDDKTILVTGAGGSIGQEIFAQILKLPIKRAIAFGHGENSIHSLITSYSNDGRFSYCIGDVRDQAKLRHEIGKFKPDIIFHAAAHKHLPLMEDYPDEAVKTNVSGTYNIALAAVENNVKNFIYISTDKAVNPSSVMGATKRIAEKIVMSLNKIQKKTEFSITRFGNVLGSRGSVIPVFVQQIENGGPVTITHPEITRFFMSIPEAARLVLKAGSLDRGRVFVLDMGLPVKITDLAKNLIRLYGYTDEEIPIRFTGLRKGEKMYEELIYSKENIYPSEYEKLFISKEDAVLMNLEEISSMVEDLATAAESYDAGRIKKTIGKYLNEYTGDGSKCLKKTSHSRLRTLRSLKLTRWSTLSNPAG